jgi:hypothetical protein
MILLFGTKSYETLLTVVSFACRYCGMSVPQRVFKRATKFSLFFIPLFTVSTSHFVECSNCAGTTALSAEQARHSIEWAASRA